jgi:N-acetylglucosamine-6-phosphate deacetylase
MKIPGLVDLQVNGYNGVDFSASDLTEPDFVRACRELLKAGTTAFLPTMITSPNEVYEHNLPIITKAMKMEEFRGRLLGIHLEGPFISPQEGARGAHNAQWIRQPDISYLEKLIDLADGKIKLITIAAEIEGAEQLTEYAASRGIAVSLGHQAAGENDLQKLIQAGASALTHLGNGVPAVLPRHENPIWAGLAEDELVAMIITDGHHLPASMLKTIIRTKGPANCIVVSDSSSLAGLEPGSYEAMGHKVVLEETGRLYDPATGYLVGSSKTMRLSRWVFIIRLSL